MEHGLKEKGMMNESVTGVGLMCTAKAKPKPQIETHLAKNINRVDVYQDYYMGVESDYFLFRSSSFQRLVAWQQLRAKKKKSPTNNPPKAENGRIYIFLY